MRALTLFLLLATAARAAGPGLEFVPAALDFGRQPENQILSANVQVKNTSGATVTISQIQSDCGCTSGQLSVPDASPVRLAPGDSVGLTVRLETNGAEGPLAHRLLLLTSAGQEALPVRAVVYHYPHWSITPPRLIFPPTARGIGARREVQLEYHGPGRPPVTAIKVGSRWFVVEPARVEGMRVSFVLRKIAQAPAGSLFDDIHVLTGDAVSPDLEIPVFAYVTEP